MPGDLEWVTTVPWSRGGGGDNADGELPEFDGKHGPGRLLTEEEEEEECIGANGMTKGVHSVHLAKKDFDNHGYTDRCAGCSSILRGKGLQTHSVMCRKRMEAVLKGDVRLENAKARLQERSKRMEEGMEGAQGRSTRRTLEEIEGRAMGHEGG